MEEQDFLDSIYHTYGIPYMYVSSNQQLLLCSSEEERRDFSCSEYTSSILDLCRCDKKNHIMVHDHHIAMAGIYRNDTGDVLLLGKVFLGLKPQQMLERELEKRYDDLQKAQRVFQLIISLPNFSEQEFTRIVKLVNYYLNQTQMEDVEISDAEETNPLNRSDEEEVYCNKSSHGSFGFEQYLWHCIENGEAQKLLDYLKYNYTGNTGVLVKNPKTNFLRYRKNQFICACTLATRAAIRGGLNSELAYSLSDFYIQNVDEMCSPDEVGHMVNTMFCDFAVRVSKLRIPAEYSTLTKRCISYIQANIRTPVDAQQTADALKVSKNYLLTKFKEEVGLSFVDYVKKAKIEEAKILLEYSDASIVEISEQLAFSSQSYFTSVFRTMVGETPKKYRELSRINAAAK